MVQTWSGPADRASSDQARPLQGAVMGRLLRFGTAAMESRTCFSRTLRCAVDPNPGESEDLRRLADTRAKQTPRVGGTRMDTRARP